MPRNVGRCKFRYEDLEALRGYRRFILQCRQHPKCTASRTISEQRSRHLGQYEPVASLAVWALLESLCAPNRRPKGQSSRESYLGVGPARVASKRQLHVEDRLRKPELKRKTMTIVLYTPTTHKFREHTHHATSILRTWWSAADQKRITWVSPVTNLLSHKRQKHDIPVLSGMCGIMVVLFGGIKVVALEWYWSGVIRYFAVLCSRCGFKVV